MLQVLNRTLGGLMGRQRTKRINLALQGGGAHGAFTWGVLDYLLEDERLSIGGISGTSAGAVNAVMLADGLARGGPEEARKRLSDFWRAASLGGNLPGPQRAVMDRLLAFLPSEGTPAQLFVDAMARFLSPYDMNPLNINPLKGLIERFVDFDILRKEKGPGLFIAATNVRTGRLRVFSRETISADVVMASAALPMMFRAVEIDGEPYWDGGYVGNPAIFPLLQNDRSNDVLLVQINPLERKRTPTSSREILHRINEITFNASLAAEMRALDFINRVAEASKGKNGKLLVRPVNVHRIVLSGPMEDLSAGTRLKTDYEFFELLNRAGRRAARNFLDEHFDDIGKRSTLDLTAETAVEVG